VTQAEATLLQSQLSLDQATLQAPFAGIVTDVAIVPGSIATVSNPVVSLIDRQTLHIDLTLSENDVARTVLNQPVALTLDAVPDWSTTGAVSFIAPAAELRNNVVTFAVRVSFPDRDTRIKVGMTANVSITVARKDDVLLVPNTALLPKGAGRVVQIPGASGQPATEREVQTGLTDGAYTEIVSGLTEGTLIVAQPTTTPRASGGFFSPP
jgi:HlyD family secretion protein